MTQLFEFIGNHLFLVSLLFALLVLLAWDIYRDSLSNAVSILPNKLVQLINHNQAIIIDLRLSSDFNSGHIIGSQHIPTHSFSIDAKEIKQHKKDQPIILCCQNGSISAQQAKLLINANYQQVYCLKGGMMAWQTAELPLRKTT